jgi:hypothetical protein
MLNRNSFLSKTLVTLVVVIYCTGLSSVILPLLEYAVDYERIIAEECENTAQPELGCDGKCYLSKQITKQTQPDTSTTDSKPIVLKAGIDPHSTHSISSRQIATISQLFASLEVFYDNIIPSRIDPPPQS